jgi:D-sedoheptulose 7-phosphate isomerase
MDVKKEILRRGRDSSVLIAESLLKNLDKIQTACAKIAAAMERGNKILFFGNGGSAAEAQHFAAEFVNRMVIERRPLPALALTTDSSVLTAIGNDRGFDELFTYQLNALAKKGDIAFGITTSGASPNVIKAMKLAKKLGLYRVGMAGAPGREIGKVSELCFWVDSPTTARIQEVHLMIGHILCDVTDLILFGEKK